MTNPVKFCTATLFFVFLYGTTILALLNWEISPELRDLIPRVMGGASALFFLFQSQTHFERVFSLFSFSLSTLSLMFKDRPEIDIDVVIMIVLIFICSFGFSFFFVQKGEKIAKETDFWFFVVLISKMVFTNRNSIWNLSFLLEILLLFLFVLLFFNSKRLKKRMIFGYIFLIFCGLLTFHFIFGDPNLLHDLDVVFLLALAGAGAMFFFFFERSDFVGFWIYFLANCGLGFVLSCNENGGILPQITLYFIFYNVIFFIFVSLIASIQRREISYVTSNTKASLAKIYFSFLYVLHSHFVHADWIHLDFWIASLTLQILFFNLLTFILKTEEGDTKT